MEVKLNLDDMILAYLLKSKHYAMELTNTIDVEYLDSNLAQWLYKTSMEHFRNPKFKEIPTANILSEYFDKQSKLAFTKQDLLEFYQKLISVQLEPAEFSWYVDKIRQRYNSKLQKQYTSTIIKTLKSNNADKVEAVNKLFRESTVAIDSINKCQSYEEGTLDESAKERARLYKETEENPEKAKGILSGFSELDMITNGLHDGELMIVGGSTGHGKSVVLHNVAVNAYLGQHNPLEPAPDENEIKGGHNILYFSLEMPKAMQERRIDACMAGVIANEIRDGRLSEEDKEKYYKVLKFQSKYAKKFKIVDMARNVTMREIELKYVESCDKYGIKFDQVYIDYLGLMKPISLEAQDWLEQGMVSAEMHEFLRSYKISGVTAVQLNDPKDPSKPQHSTSRIARSRTIPTNANIILEIGSRENEDTRIDMPVYITKMRDGGKGSFILTKDFARMRVVDLTDETFGEEDDDVI